MEDLIARARKRDADAEYTLAMMAYEGRGVPRDLGQALRLMERAARRGHLDAQNALRLFPAARRRRGSPNPVRARDWYEVGRRAWPRARAGESTAGCTRKASAARATR